MSMKIILITKQPNLLTKYTRLRWDKWKIHKIKFRESKHIFQIPVIIRAFLISNNNYSFKLGAY